MIYEIGLATTRRGEGEFNKMRDIGLPYDLCFIEPSGGRRREIETIGATYFRSTE